MQALNLEFSLQCTLNIMAIPFHYQTFAKLFELGMDSLQLENIIGDLLFTNNVSDSSKSFVVRKGTQG